MTEEKRWYICYVGNPKKVECVRTVFSEAVGKDFLLWVPTQEVIQRGPGNEVSLSTRAMFPGYVLIQFAYAGSQIDDQLYDAKAGFLLRGPGSGMPTALTDEDVEIIKIHEKEKVEEDLTGGMAVTIGSFVELTNGPFIGAKGTVTGVKKNKVLIELVIFGRLVDVEVDDRFVRYSPSEPEKEMIERKAQEARRQQTKANIEKVKNEKRTSTR